MRAVRHMSIAFALPATRGRRCVPPSPGVTPSLILRLPEPGVVGRDDDVAGHRELAPASERVAGDGGDDGLSHLLDAFPSLEVAGGEHVHRVLVHHLRDVGAGRERLLVAGDDHRTDGVVRVETGECMAELVDQRSVERVQHLRPVEHDQADRASRFGANACVVHQSILMVQAIPATLARCELGRTRPRGLRIASCSGEDQRSQQCRPFRIAACLSGAGPPIGPSAGDGARTRA